MASRGRRQLKRQSKVPHDVILPVQEPYMQQIVSGLKTYEFRRYRIRPEIERVWFYRTAPHSNIEYICEIAPVRTRNPDDEPLEENGLGNKEFNDHHEDYHGYDYAYKILSVYQLERPLTLHELQRTYGLKSAPRGLVYTPQSILEKVSWKDSKKLL